MTLKPRASHIIVTAIAALALVFGGGVAGAVAGAKWINGHDIKPGSIPANRLKGASVGTKQIKKHAVRGDRIAKRTITTNELTDETVEELQPTVEYVDRRIVTTQHITDPAYQMVPATCPEGSQAVGGYVHGERTALYDTGYDYVDTSTGAFMVRIYSHENGIEDYANVQVMCIH